MRAPRPELLGPATVANPDEGILRALTTTAAGVGLLDVLDGRCRAAAMISCFAGPYAELRRPSATCSVVLLRAQGIAPAYSPCLHNLVAYLTWSARVCFPGNTQPSITAVIDYHSSSTI